MANFETIMQGQDLEPIHGAFTSSVTFNTPDFKTWLESNGYLENTSGIRVSMGIYTQAAAEELRIPQSAGRLTVFVWPINNDNDPPFNLGSGTP
jgi:hypothetical protein